MGLPILMYHSISDDGPGPVSLPRRIFKDQLAVLADAGVRGVTVSDYMDARRNGRSLEPGSVVLTFDDAYQDFADTAWPELQKYGWTATVFVPIMPVDRDRPWDCGDGHDRRLMTWTSVRDLAGEGVEMAAHSMRHLDLTALPHAAALAEIMDSGRALEQQIGRRTQGFAPPFGRITATLRRELPASYAWCAGARLARATAQSDVYDLPRIEMWYFRSIEQWRRFVSSGWTPYFALRAGLRAVKRLL